MKTVNVVSRNGTYYTMHDFDCGVSIMCIKIWVDFFYKWPGLNEILMFFEMDECQLTKISWSILGKQNPNFVYPRANIDTPQPKQCYNMLYDIHTFYNLILYELNNPLTLSIYLLKNFKACNEN